MDGIINIYKPKGMTSHDVVSKLRKILNTKKIGHTGTLDPDAEGVLPICVGKGTRLVEYLTDKDKKYRAELVLGITTDTQDLSGQIISKNEVNISKDTVQNVITSFIGEVEQIPPMYSAVKVNGQKLYQLARQGKTIEREKRKIQIYDIWILEIDLQNNKTIFDVECSKGTYIRTLCNDIGQKLGVGGCMGSLIRLKSGEFDIDNSTNLEEVDKLYKNNEISKFLLPVDFIFGKYQSVMANNNSLKWILNGAKIYYKDIIFTGKLSHNQIVRIYDLNNNFLALYKVESDNSLICEKMFV